MFRCPIILSEVLKLYIIALNQNEVFSTVTFFQILKQDLCSIKLLYFLSYKHTSITLPYLPYTNLF